MFFKSRPNLGTNEKAQVEFGFEWISNFVGPDRLRFPVRLPNDLLGLPTANDVVVKLGRFLDHDVSGLKVLQQPATIESCGGGG